MAKKSAGTDGPIIIKKYANRRLYNTDTSSYVTLDNIAELIKSNEEFVVQDAKSGEDITRSVLAQIIMDRESKDQSMLPLPFLRQLISLYGGNLESMVPSYLESTLDTLTLHQNQLRDAMLSAKGPQSVMPVIEEMTRRNMALFEQSLDFFTGQKAKPQQAPETATKAGTNNNVKDKEIAELKAQLQNLQEKVNALE